MTNLVATRFDHDVCPLCLASMHPLLSLPHESGLWYVMRTCTPCGVSVTQFEDDPPTTGDGEPL